MEDQYVPAPALGAVYPTPTTTDDGFDVMRAAQERAMAQAQQIWATNETRSTRGLCSTNTHVFECRHERVCVCGQVSRIVPAGL